MILILLGNRRKYIPRTRLRIALWSCYLLADWVAAVALGVISRIALDVCDKSHSRSTSELMTFWAPFLLLHLGGPDTITAYSLEDNELWLRHLAGLVIQAGVALYIFLLAWPGCSGLPILSIFVQVVGLIKYSERIWALRSANTEHLRDSMLTSPDPGPNYHTFLEEVSLKRAQGFHVEVEEVTEPPLSRNDHSPCSAGQGKLISEAFDLFKTFKRLFVDLILTFQDRDESQAYFRGLTPEKAFNVVEIELSFAYDMLYTKAHVAYTFPGLILRLICVSFLSGVAVSFILLCHKDDYHMIDWTITCLLLIVAILLEIYAAVVMLRSDWMDHLLSRHNKTRRALVFQFLRQTKKSRWSNSMAQYNLFSVCLEEKPACCYKIQKLLGIDQDRVKHRYKTYNEVSNKLKQLIFSQCVKFMDSSSDPRALCTHRGSFSLKENDCSSLVWSISKVEFDQSILLWHIATNLCYYMEVGDEDQVEVSSNCSESKNISDYMLYLLVTFPFMLPIGIGLIRFRDTCAEAERFFKEKGPIRGKAEACQKLLQVNSMELSPGKVKGDRCKSVLFDACRLAISLRLMEREQKWQLMSQVWVEILAYAATHCRGYHHAQQLRKGGELLTHVWLLMAQMGITEQFQVSQGHARAKLIVK